MQGEPFLKYLEQFKNLLAQWRHHVMESEGCIKLYMKNLITLPKHFPDPCVRDYEKGSVRCLEIFRGLIMENNAVGLPQREVPTSTSTNEGATYSIDKSIIAKGKIAGHMRRFEALESSSALQAGQVNQLQTPHVLITVLRVTLWRSVHFQRIPKIKCLNKQCTTSTTHGQSIHSHIQSRLEGPPKSLIELRAISGSLNSSMTTPVTSQFKTQCGCLPAPIMLWTLGQPD